MKSENEKPRDNSIFENSKHENNFEVEKVGHKNSVILNYADSNHINADSNPSICADYNQDNSNQSIPVDLTTINDSSDVRALIQLLSWYRDSADAEDSTVSTRTPLAYVLSIHTAHKSSPIHAFHSYPPVTAPRTFTYGTSDPPSPSHDSSAESVTP